MDKDAVARRVQQAYDRLGHSLGWSLLACPWANLAAPEVALITLNPGGNVFSPPGLSEEKGSAYVEQDWLGKGAGAEPLQRQIQRLCVIADVDIRQVLAGYLVPFRSPSWRALARPDESLAFGVELWAELLGGHRPRVTFPISDVVFQAVRGIFGGGDIRLTDARWGKVQIRSCDYPGGRLIGLPHLSRYRLLSASPQADPSARSPRETIIAGLIDGGEWSVTQARMPNHRIQPATNRK